MQQHLPSLTDVDAEWLADTIARNHERFGGFFMGPDDDADDDDADAEGDDDTDDDKDDKGDDETDWKAKFEAQQRINRTLERRTRKDAARLKQLDTKPAPKDKPADKGEELDPEKIREEARQEARREQLHGRVEDKIEAKAHSFADPEDAVAVLLRSHEIDDFLDGDKIDAEAIADALKELGEKKPHLLAQGSKFKGDPDQGTRKENPGRPKNLGDAVSRAYKR